MKTIIKATTFFLATLLSSYISNIVWADTTTSTQPAASTTQPTVINKFLQFVLKAQSATVKPMDNNKSQYQLELQGVDNSILYFTNRPRRIADLMTTSFFLKRWIKPPPHDFKTTPPNAAIIYANKNADVQHDQVVMLMDPIYDEKTGRLQFTIQSTTGKALTLPPQLEKPIITMGEVTVCGTLGAWGNLPGEKQYDVACHKAGG